MARLTFANESTRADTQALARRMRDRQDRTALMKQIRAADKAGKKGEARKLRAVLKRGDKKSGLGANYRRLSKPGGATRARSTKSGSSSSGS